MAEFELSYDKERKRVYLKEEVAKILDTDPNTEGPGTIKALVNAKTVLLYSEDENYDNILESLDILKRDIELRKRTTEDTKK